MYTFNKTSLVNAKSNQFTVRWPHQHHSFTHYPLIHSIIFIPVVSDERLKRGKKKEN